MAFIEFQNISKAFAGVQALSDVTLSIEEGECHGLMGENGAGKSTLGKVLAGVHKHDSGVVRISGIERRFASPAQALIAGVGMVHQELAFCPDLSVAENLCMSAYPTHAKMFVNRWEMNERATDLLRKIGVEMDVTQRMHSLTTAQEQMVQIAAAVGTGARVIVFDEPTSSLSERDVRQLFGLIGDLKARGVTLVYVSHRMPEIVRLCDRVSVLRDGKYVGTLKKEEITEDAVVRMMVGRSVATHQAKHISKPAGEVKLDVRELSSVGKFQDVNFSVRAGEIVGFAGLVGSGRSEIAQALFGLDPNARGSATLVGQPLKLGDIRRAKRQGLALLPEDRKRQGLVLQMSCMTNTTMGMLERVSLGGFLRKRKEREITYEYFRKLAVKANSPETVVGTLSGGNQQKIALAKWLARDAKVLIVDEPTRGVDVGAKAAIHAILDDLAQAGMAIVLISSELPELISLSTRVLVMREGRLVKELTRAEADQETVLRFMAGVGPGVSGGAAA